MAMGHYVRDEEEVPILRRHPRHKTPTRAAKAPPVPQPLLPPEPPDPPVPGVVPGAVETVRMAALEVAVPALLVAMQRKCWPESPMTVAGVV